MSLMYHWITAPYLVCLPADKMGSRELSCSLPAHHVVDNPRKLILLEVYISLKFGAKTQEGVRRLHRLLVPR